MAYEQKELTGSLFKNDKGDNPKRPDYRGSVTIEGRVWELSAWIQEGQKGKYMSIKAQVPRQQEQRPSGPSPAESDIPF